MDIATKRYSSDIGDYSLESENKSLKDTVIYLKSELDRLKKQPLLVCDVLRILEDKAVIRLANGSKFFVNISGDAIGKISIGDRVLVEQKFLNIVDRLDQGKRYDVDRFVLIEKPQISWDDIGGLKNQIRDIKEVIELPLNNPELFKEVGITPPKGVLLHGHSGTGKTLLAKAVDASNNSCFIGVVGSELNQKFIGEGAKLVKDLFTLAREKAPSIIFIDELDAIASDRVDFGVGGEREVQRTFMQLLNELDGFHTLHNVRLIGATNRIEALDNAILRPGRLDRLIEVPLPTLKEREEIFRVHTRKMKLQDVDFKKIAQASENFSGAEIKSVCTEAGYFAIREKRTIVNHADFSEALKKILQDFDEDHLHMFG